MATLTSSREQRNVSERAFELLYLAAVEEITRTRNNDADAIASALEAIGYRTGLRLLEWMTLERSRFTSELEVVKFVCKEVWMLAFSKMYWSSSWT